MLILRSYGPLLLASIASAQAQSATSTSSAPISTYTVAVGEALPKAGLIFSPNIIQAGINDIIEFRFYPQNHSVARAEFKYPCIPYEDTGINKVGFWGGFHPVSVVLPDPPKFTIRINDTSPVFFYCSAPGACINDGMVGVINPNETQTFDIQQAYAKNSTIAFSPGESFPSEQTTTASSLSTSTTSTSTSLSTSSPTSTILSSTGPSPTSEATSTATTSAAAITATQTSLSGGAIGGITVGAVAILALVGCLFYLCGRQRTMTQLLLPQRQSYNVSSSPFLPMIQDNARFQSLSSMAGGLDDRSQIQSPGFNYEERRDFNSPVLDGNGDGFTQNTRNSGNNRSGTNSTAVDQWLRNPNGGETDIDNGVLLLPEALRLNRPSSTGPTGPHELAVPSRNSSQAQTPKLFNLHQDYRITMEQ